MFIAKNNFRRPFAVLLASAGCLAATYPLFADDVSTQRAGRAPSAQTVLIQKLVDRGAITREDAAELLKIAKAEEADAKVQAAMTALAITQAEAAQARAEAAAVIHAEGLKNTLTQNATPTQSAYPLLPDPKDAASSPVVPAEVPAAVAVQATPVETSGHDPILTSEAAPEVPKSKPVKTTNTKPVEDDDTVHVTYVPEVVKNQLREEIKNEVLQQAKEERWASPRAFPEWVTRFSLYGDFRFRYEGIYNHQQNKDFIGNPNFWNYNSINTGSPYDLSPVSNLANPPVYNVDQNRSRLRVRARLGVSTDLGEGFVAGVRIATGENNSPISQNQTLGAAGSGQGGNFSKFGLWLDRAYLKYQSSGDLSRALTVTVGRFENPFLSTSIIWADDLGFDGAVMTVPAQIHYDGLVVDSVKPYFVLGAFPVFNTDLNYSSNWPDKYKSNDKWLQAGQLGVDLKFGRDTKLKLGAAYYYFTKMVGKTSTPYEPLTASDGGDTDARRPAFAQKGNTYMELRDILDTTRNVNASGAAINRWQYFGLASAFRNVAFDARLDYNHFEPFQVSLLGEYIKNTGFDRAKILSRRPFNNLGATTEDFVGGNTAWIVGVKLGHAVLQQRWDWMLTVNYRQVESDAVIDGFCDSDFGGGGTNVKGLTLGANVALARRVNLGAKWMSSTQAEGPTLKNDVLQLDLNAKF